VLSSHPSPDLRLRYCARGQSGHTSSAPRLSAPGRCAGAIAACPRVSRKSFWHEAPRAVAFRRLGIGPGSDHCRRRRVSVVRNGRRSPRSHAQRGILPRRKRHSRNADRLYKPWRVQVAPNSISGLFRDHHLSDLIGFVYSRMEAKAAAADLHARLRMLGEKVSSNQPLTVCLFLDGENAWEYYPGNGREFLREFYRGVESDPDFRALTASEAITAAGEVPVIGEIFPGSWINANFDVWIGHGEDVTAWVLLWDAREVYAHAVEAHQQGRPGAPMENGLKEAHESLLAAEGSDWCWWFGPEHSTANDAEFDALYRKHLTGIHLSLGQVAPEELAKPIKRRPEHALQLAPTSLLNVTVDGRDTSYFEWLGAGLYSPERRGGSMHGRVFYLHELRYGFEEGRFCVRIDPFAEALGELEDPEFRITIGGEEEVTLVV